MEVNGEVPEQPLEQFELALENIKRNLEAADMQVNNLTKMVFYLVGEFNAEKRRELIADFLDGHLPCTTMIYVVALAAPKFKVEIDAWACKECS